MSTGGGVLFSIFLLLALSLNGANGSVAGVENGTGAVAVRAEAEMVPFIEPGKAEMVMMVNYTRRKLGSFRICALCTCCSGSRGVCLPSPCCYAINSNIPNRPFGFCSFTPKTCNCLGCQIWVRSQQRAAQALCLCRTAASATVNLASSCCEEGKGRRK